MGCSPKDNQATGTKLFHTGMWTEIKDKHYFGLAEHNLILLTYWTALCITTLTAYLKHILKVAMNAYFQNLTCFG